MPLAEIRRRYGSRNGPPPPSVILALSRDGRAGARTLGARLSRVRSSWLLDRQRLRGLCSLEDRLHRAGIDRVAGVDEVGMGPLAGPVVAAAVILPHRRRIPGLDDSKRLTAAARERLDTEIRTIARSCSIGWATVEEIDRLNIYRAGLLAMRRAVEGLSLRPERVICDGRAIPDLGLPQEAVPGGDARVAAVAAASVVAKVYRDAWMTDLERRYPGYGFGRNAGYATLQHRRALVRLGPCPVHRMSYEPVRDAGPIRGRS